MTKKATKFQWTEACEHSFQELKDRLTSTPVLTLPEGSEGYTVYCDAFGVGLGCIMEEAYHSRYSIQRDSTKMYNDIKKIYWWHRMKKDVAEFVAHVLTANR
ncbi:uncharacterized protein [Solanum tuberosum]|uniref:uncharacterized protein n=1 Tax=Solanum tuberosum TaxID=4113 RepID=UPI00073A2DF1|nr:PREDICTED: uncharacterized protein LOC107063425 [Solanum tuberosum]